MEENYFKSRNIKTNQKIREILKSLPEFCTEFIIGIEASTLPLTRLNYIRDIKTFFEFLTSEIATFQGIEIKELSTADLERLNAGHIEMFLSFVSSYEKNGKTITNEVNAKARKLSAIKSLLKYLYRRDKISKDVSAKVLTPKIREKAIIRLEDDEVVKILDTAQSGIDLTKKQKDFNKKTSVRDLAILTLLLGTGMRVSECVGLNVNDVDFSTNGLKITRKGGKTAILYFGDEVEEALSNYLTYRSSLDIPDDEEALFLSLQNKRLCVRSVEKLVKKYAQISSPLKKITPHKLRSTYGTSLYRQTKDIYIVADVLGHKDVNTTKKHYAALSEDNRREVANKVKLR